MRKCCFIIPYFGNFPNYFQLFLNSCKFNPDYNWLIFTDNNKSYNYPSNVKLIKITFKDFIDHIQSFFDFKIIIHTPHKLCDYKPAYGYLFENYLKEFRFWGYCDLDLILGNLNNYLTDDLFEVYDKIFCLGHMTIFKNTPENNRIFLQPYKGKLLYKIAFTTEKTTTFDEEWRDENNINQLFISKGKKVFTNDYSMNPSILYNHFIRTQYVGINKSPKNHGYINESLQKAIYTWDHGHLFRYTIKDKKLKKEEFIYMHLQARKMKVDKQILNSNLFKIVPDEFLPLEVPNITLSNFNNIKKKGNCHHLQRIYWKRLKRKIKKFFRYAKN